MRDVPGDPRFGTLLWLGASLITHPSVVVCCLFCVLLFFIKKKTQQQQTKHVFVLFYVFVFVVCVFFLGKVGQAILQMFRNTYKAT